jgi:hypothetical protein
MAEAIKRGKGSGSHEEDIDLSAGFVPKNLPTESSSEATSSELTPDSFMAKQLPTADLGYPESRIRPQKDRRLVKGGRRPARRRHG